MKRSLISMAMVLMLAGFYVVIRSLATDTIQAKLKAKLAVSLGNPTPSV